MQVKIDTKEKFHVITIQEQELTANMTDDLRLGLLTYLKNETKNVVLNLKDVNFMDDSAAECLINIQQAFYEQQSSFVICHLQGELQSRLDAGGLLELLNEVPTTEEAGDIVQMEEIERELLGDGDTGSGF